MLTDDPSPTSLSSSTYQQVQNYYDIAGPDYAAWSSNFNMHFGYCRSFTDIFFLERMLRNMNNLVMEQLAIDPQRPSHIADLGCGVATVARHFASRLPMATIKAVTISNYQLHKGHALNMSNNLSDQIEMIGDNFEQLSFPADSFTHAYAIESACHANGADKSRFIAEMARVLKPGGRFCIADGFLKHGNPLPRGFNFLYRKIIRYWALPCFGNIQAFCDRLREHGLHQLQVREISWRIAPSVAYVPWTCLKFFVREIARNRSLRMKKERWHNVYAPVLGMLLGLYRRHFGYYLITGVK